MEIIFLNPIEGDLLITGADGELSAGALLTPVRVQAPPLCGLGINGLPARYENGVYEALVPLRRGFNRIEATAGDGTSAAIRVWWLEGAQYKYRFTVDDCIRCFEDIAAHAHTYRSIFENPFLNLFHRAHEEYGSKVHINVFYETVDGAFNLSMMPDCFREEFGANAGWLSLSFHAMREFPDEPYRDADYATVMADCERVTRQIIRFAGEKVLRNSTTLHWGAANARGVRALHDSGFRALCGYLFFDEKGDPLVSYHLTPAQVAHAEKREGWVDFDEDVIFTKLDFVLNSDQFPAHSVAPYLDELSARPHEGRFIQMVIHEQYFYPDYFHYEPDYAQRVMNMARWMKSHGYESISLDELIR